MMTIGRRLGLAACVGALALASPACTNSDPLSPQPGQLQVNVGVSPAGAGSFDSFIMNLRQVGIRPITTGSNSSIGSDPIGSFTQQIGLNFAVGGDRLLGVVNLPAGPYRVTDLKMTYSNTPPMFIKSSPVRPTDPCNASNCRNYVVYRTATPLDPNDPDGARVNGFLPSPEILAPFRDFEFDLDIPNSPTFELQPGSGASVSVRFNGSALAQLFENAFTCKCTGTCGSQPAPCMSGYAHPTAGQILSTITIE